MNFLKNYIKEHYAIFLIVFSIWMSSLFLGMYVAFCADSDISGDITKYIETALNDGKGFLALLKNGIGENFRYTLLLCIASSFLILLPVSVLLIGFKGFATGFTASFIIKAYGFKGMAVTITTVVLPLVFTMPVYLIMFISSLHFPVYTFSVRKQILSSERWTMHITYMTKMLILFCVLSIITVAEAFLSPYFFSILNKG